MRPATRPQYHRLQRILEMIREGTRTGCLPNCGHFIRELEVSRRSLMRDLDFLRDDQHAPIAYDDSRKGFYLTDPTFSLPPVQLTRREVSGKASGAQLGAGRRGSESGQGREAQHLALKARGRIDLANITHHVSGVVGSLTEDREGNKRSIGLLPILHSAFFLLHSSDRPQTAPTLPPYRLACCKAPLSNLRMQKEECRMKKGPGEATTQGMQKAECRMKKGPGEATLMRHQCDIKATSMRVASQAVATPMRPPCDLKATFMRPQSHPHATPRLPQGSNKAWRRTADDGGKAEIGKAESRNGKPESACRMARDLMVGIVEPG